MQIKAWVHIIWCFLIMVCVPVDAMGFIGAYSLPVLSPSASAVRCLALAPVPSSPSSPSTPNTPTITPISTPTNSPVTPDSPDTSTSTPYSTSLQTWSPSPARNSPTLPVNNSSSTSLSSSSSPLLAALVLAGNVIAFVDRGYDANGVQSFSTSILALSWPSGTTDSIQACAIHGKQLYMAGNYGLLATVPVEDGGLTRIFSSSSSLKPNYSSLLISNSYLSSSSSTRPVFAWGHSSVVTRHDDVTGLEVVVDVGFIPIGGHSILGFVYFYGNNQIVQLTDPELQENTRVQVHFSLAGISPNGEYGYFFEAEGHCGIRVRTVNMQNLSVISNFTLIPPTPLSFCSSNDRKVSVDEHYIYFLVSLRQVIYKISRATLSITDILAASQITNAPGVYMEGIVAGDMIVGFDYSLLLYSSKTCNIDSYFSSNGLCEVCPLGTAPMDPYSSSACVPCPFGSNTTKPGVCTFCAAGTRAVVKGNNITCEQCPSGSYTDGLTISYNCSLCPAGQYGANPGFCNPCPAGSFSNNTGALACTACPAGAISSKNNTSCVTCPPGYYSHNSSACSVCPAGKKAVMTRGVTTCEWCPLGMFTNGFEVAYSCLSCPAGQYGISPGFCQVCPAGSYSYDTGALKCLNCPDGRFSSTEGSTNCTECPAGSFIQQNMSYCTPCPDLFYSPAGSGECLPCPEGTHGAGVGAAYCPSCMPGYISKEKSASCQICEPGTFQSSLSYCMNCPMGTYGPGEGLSECEPCENGAIAAAEGLKRCVPCSDDEFSKNRTKCLSCKEDIWNSSGLCKPIAQIGLGVIGSVVFIAILGGVFWWWRRPRRGLHAIGDDDDDDDSDEVLDEFDVED